MPAESKRKYEILAFADKKRYEEEKDKWVPPTEPKGPKKRLIKARKSVTGRGHSFELELLVVLTLREKLS